MDTLSRKATLSFSFLSPFSIPQLESNLSRNNFLQEEFSAPYTKSYLHVVLGKYDKQNHMVTRNCFTSDYVTGEETPSRTENSFGHLLPLLKLRKYILWKIL